MGNGMMCSTSIFCSGAVVEQVEQKTGFGMCSTTTPPYGVGGGGGALPHDNPEVEQSGAQS